MIIKSEDLRVILLKKAGYDEAFVNEVKNAFSSYRIAKNNFSETADKDLAKVRISQIICAEDKITYLKNLK